MSFAMSNPAIVVMTEINVLYLFWLGSPYERCGRIIAKHCALYVDFTGKEQWR